MIEVAPRPDTGNSARPSGWNDWRWQMSHRIRSVDRLLEMFPGLADAPGLAKVCEKFPIAITPYYASLIRRADASDPVFQMAVPQSQELFDPPFLHADPLNEEKSMPVPGLIHRYPDRALIMATTTCSMYCRHCTRKRVAGTRESVITAAELKAITGYLAATPQINDVIISGGDPFTMPMDMLEQILATVRSIPSIDIVRIGTRTPVVMPQRITHELVDMLKKHHPVWVNTHFNHPVEITPEARAACERLVDAGIPVGNQTVLLKGINDDPLVLEELCRGLVKMRVRPYYLFQCDLVSGIEHFRTPVSRGIEIMEYLRGRLSGLAIPCYVVDAPHGGGKIPLLPNYIVSTSPTHTVLRNSHGIMVSYPEPGMHAAPLEGNHADGVWELASGKAARIAPSTADDILS
ncbi:MAG: lysine 2,3-aminomutase [Verrucomicrobia bacterium]|nr:lysine 2,3-aminomutase [Verrucomicrobiota bacterium]